MRQVTYPSPRQCPKSGSLFGWGVCFLAATLAILLVSTQAEAQSCSPPLSNKIVCENALPGNLPSEWDIDGIGDSTIQGFATDISVNLGGTIRFKIDTPASAYSIDIYRLGYYGGMGARKVATVAPSAPLPQQQPACLREPSTGLVDCGNWAISASWIVPSAVTSGVYIAKLTRPDTGGASHIPFIVRDDAGNSSILFQTSDTTWQAYNDYAGNNLYPIPPVSGPGPGGRSYKVSYNRPFITRASFRFEVSYLFWSEYPMIRWLESNGFDVSYASGVDTDRRGSAALRTHKVFLSVGHDEYWSGGQRANVEAARGAGVHLAFFSGNDVFWKTRWENSIDGSNTSYRTLVCYKETHEDAKTDPTASWTGTWRDPRFSPPSDGGRPENALTGTLFMVNAYRMDPIVVSAAEGKHRFWRNTGIDQLAPGETASLPAGVLGYEWNEVVDNGFQPAGLIRLSTTTEMVDEYLRDFGTTYTQDLATHSLTLYRHSSGALVFSAGSTQWAWGLDVTHDTRDDDAPPVADVRMQQATVNLFADMGIQPMSLATNLIPGIPPLADSNIAPASTIIQPTAGTASQCAPITIRGTASANGGGQVSSVEYSTDGGLTWHWANGTEDWSVSWAPVAPGPATIRSRAVNEYGVVEIPSLGVPINVLAGGCNVALASAGATVWGSSLYSDLYLPESAIDNERTGVNWNNNGGWSDGTANQFPDWLQVNFDGEQTINRVVVYTVQDNHAAPVEPTNDLTFSLYGVTDFTVQGWNGSSWVTLGTVTGNNLVKREVTFPAFKTDQIRIHVTNALYYFARIVEVEAWSVDPPTAAPTGLNAIAVSSTQVYLSWADRSYNETGFKIERKTGSGAFAQIAVVGANVISFLDAGRSPSTTYQYRIRAASPSSDSAYSNTVTVTTPAASLLPATPTALTATAVSASQINLSWTDNANNESGFRIERALSSGSFTQIATTSANVTTFSDTGRAANTTYQYRVRANNGSGNSAYSNIAMATTATSTPIPPTSPVATAISATQINLSWTDNSINETSFKIERKTGLGGTYAQIASVAANVTSFADTGAVPGTSHYYRVRGTNGAGNSAYSGEAGATTFPPFLPSPWQQTDIGSTGIEGAANHANGSFTVWGSGADIWGNADAFSYLYQTLTGDGEIVARVVSVQNTNSWAKAGVMIRENSTPGSAHAMVVMTPGNGVSFQRRVSAGGVSASTTTPSVSAPYWVRLVRTGNVLTGYASSSGVTWTQIGADTIPMGATVQVGLALTSHDNAALNASVFSNVSINLPPDAPTGLGAVVDSSSQISLSWIDVSNETGYKIERKTGAAGTYAQIATVGAGVTTYSSSGLAPLTTYFFRVRATSSVGDSGYSAETNATTLDAPPAAPSGLAASATTSTQINLTWTDNSPNETGFKIESKIGAAGVYAEIATVGAGVTSFSNTALTPLTTYYFRVRATNALGDSAYTSEVNATTPGPPPTPGGLTASAVSGTQVNLSWADVATETGYKIERKTDSSGVYAEIATVGAGVTTYNNTGLTPGTSYFYRVRATNTWGDSAYSTEVNAATPTLPATPTGLAANVVSPTQIDLSWSDVATETGYKIERKTGAAGTYAQIATVGAGVTTYSNTGLTALTTYYYRVRANNAAGDSPYSTEANATTWGPPVAPAGLTANAISPTQVDLSWADVATESGYKIERKTGAAGTYAQIATVGAGVTTYSNTGLTALTTYYYRVRANNAAGDSPYSTEANATTLGPPSTPSGLTANAVSTSQIGLAWGDVATETGFKIERKTGAAGTYAQIATVGAGVITYNDTGLTASTNYFYRVRATNTFGDSGYSTEANATTLGPPVAPSGLTANAVSTSQIGLAWGDVAAETGFKIERKTGAAGTYAQIATVGAGVTTYNDTGLTASTNYYYRVRATNTFGDSGYSAEANATTLALVPATPTGLIANAVSSTQIDLAWGDVATETGYKIERKTGAAGTYSQIATVAANVTTYSNTGLTAGTTYFYRVRANNAAGDSGYSTEASATAIIPAFRGAASAGAPSGTLTLGIARPAGTVQGDVMVASIAVRPSSATITAPSGWTLVRRVNNATGNTNSLAVYYKVAGASEPASYSWTFNTSTGSAGGIQSFSGINTTTPIDVEAGQNTASGLTLAAPSVTTRFAYDMVVTSHGFSSSATFTPPSGMTQAFDVASDSVLGSGGESIQGNYRLQPAIGATGTMSATASNDADVGNTHTLTLRAK
jgi:fibronectin type 3 domain-containing protein/regulation of enolase protein 1 (concanavalin A-like superfamily)